MSELLKLLSPLTGARILSQNKDLLRQLIRRNIELKYRGSVLGMFWSFVQPLLMLSVYTLVFGFIFRPRWIDSISDSKAAFAIIMFCGMALFNIFNESVSCSSRLITSNPNYIKKIVFPTEILPVAQVCSTLILSCIWFLLLLAGKLFCFPHPLSWTMILFPLPLIPLLLITLGVSWFVASLGVYLRDIQQFVVVLLQILYFMTPIFYPVAAVPEKIRFIWLWNPLSQIVEQTRALLLYNQLPNWGVLLYTFLFGAVVFQLGLVWFLKTKRGFTDVL